MNNFESFLQETKNNRSVEIKSVQNKGYSSNSKEYKFFDYFSVKYLEREYKFSLFLNNNEANFLIVEEYCDEHNSVIKKRSKYYSMIALFEEVISLDKDKMFLDAISNGERETIKMEYRGYLYALEIPMISKKNRRKLIKANSNLVGLFLLFSLIQNKSNCILKRQPEYQDGIYRFFQVYCDYRYDNEPMKKRGWTIEKQTFIYKTYFPIKMIRIEFSGKEEMKEERIFFEKLKTVNSEEDSINVFLDEFNKKNGTTILKENIDSFPMLSTKELEQKEIQRCTNMTSFMADSKKDRFYTKKPIALGINRRSYIFIIEKFNKKYYLTEEELNEIIKIDPRKSSADGGS